MPSLSTVLDKDNFRNLDRTCGRFPPHVTTERPTEEPPRDTYIYYPDAFGVFFAHGSRFGGHSLFLKDGAERYRIRRRATGHALVYYNGSYGHYTYSSNPGCQVVDTEDRSIASINHQLSTGANYCQRKMK
ncbi:hypothetical protein ACONUD_11870 [Microbulbifer harenosus]|uniref:Uncharacterized protein n=1 Tax=Microbulbifer harenosus TaxID=2576840 RepID=A0ABY2UDQ6_9GAMM|nr:hypothetical protein [Microbulbifer harenosus]TLM74770.1 hypothetical protein FDY93_17215 [Microbulbifer harenosus]